MPLALTVYPGNPAARDVVLTLPDGRRVVVTVFDKGRGKVRLGISAPADVKVLRGDLDRRDGAK